MLCLGFLYEIESEMSRYAEESLLRLRSLTSPRKLARWVGNELVTTLPMHKTYSFIVFSFGLFDNSTHGAELLYPTPN